MHEGDASKWHEAASKADAIVNAHHEASDRSRRMLQVLESSWTGAGADAAANKIRMGAQATQTSAEVYASNARVYTDGAHTFDTIKRELPPVAEKPPERDVIDVLTPWDTDTEDQINQHKADVERARQIYQSYEQTMQSAQQHVVTDFGSLDTFDGELGKIERDKSSAAKDAGTGIRTFDEPTSSRSSSPSSSQPVTTGGPMSTSGPTAGPTPGYSTPHLTGSPQPSSSTSASGYVTPDIGRPAAAAPNYSTPPSFGPGTNVGPGGNNPYHAPTFGPGGTPVRFGPGAGGGPGSAGPAGGGGRFSAPGMGGMGGGAKGMPGGGPAPGGPGAPGVGRTVGAAPFGPAGGGPVAGGVAGGAAGAAGARGGMPMGAMGGAGRGGQGGGDEEHQRQYVQSTDEAFALTEDGEALRDPVTGNIVAPPTIGG
ncbi:hypothetical protein ACWGPQ_17910 [Saccharomonospora azurea]